MQVTKEPDAIERTLSPVERAEAALDVMDRVLRTQNRKAIAAAVLQLAARGGRLDS
jgi:hypothetical protein